MKINHSQDASNQSRSPRQMKSRDFALVSNPKPCKIASLHKKGHLDGESGNSPRVAAKQKRSPSWVAATPFSRRWILLQGPLDGNPASGSPPSGPRHQRRRRSCLQLGCFLSVCEWPITNICRRSHVMPSIATTQQRTAEEPIVRADEGTGTETFNGQGHCRNAIVALGMSGEWKGGVTSRHQQY